MVRGTEMGQEREGPGVGVGGQGGVKDGTKRASSFISWTFGAYYRATEGFIDSFK